MDPLIHEIAENIYLTDKPAGPSSFGWISRVKRSHGFTKIGHAGTLDPFASGLMILGVNSGTKKISQYVGLPKSYRATIVLGKATDTLDPTGTVTAENYITLSDYHKVSLRIPKLFLSLVGSHKLAVPSFSAKQVGGKRLYKLARAGKSVPSVFHTAVIARARVLDHWYQSGTIYIDCELSVSSGTYIRSIAEYIGKKLRYPAHVYQLQRTSIGVYSNALFQ